MDEHHSITIDGWQIDSLSYRITREGVEKKLEPRSMELLLYLADRPNEVVTRQEIEDDVWQGRVVGYDALSSSIAKIRKAFDDTNKKHRVIETISKAGYRLIAPVLIEADVDSSNAGDQDSAGENFERKLTVALYADVAGYSRLSGEDEDRTHRQLRQNMKTISEAIIRFQGRIIHYAGDAVLADFSTASNALHCALDVQQKISEINSHLPENQRVLFRIGVNLGEVIVDGTEIYGDGVNVAARLESLADAGGVCISGTVFDAIGQKQIFEFEYHGEKSVKNIERPVRTYSVHLRKGASIPVPETTPDSPAHPKQRHNRKLFWVLAVCLLALLLMSALWQLYQRFTPPPPPPGSSIAIMLFDNKSNDPGQTVYAHGLTNDLITDLSNIDGLAVTPWHVISEPDNENLSVLEITELYRVRYIVQGSFRRSLDDIRVNVQMVDSVSGVQVWAERFDAKVENVFKLQDKIIAGILTVVGLEATETSRSKRRTTNLEAYDYFLRAEHRRLLGRGSERDNKALEFYQRAIELDPSFIAAYTGLAREALTNWQLDASQVMPAAASKKLVYESAGKALELDPENAEANAVLGLIQAISGSHETGISSVKRALEIEPSNPSLHADLAQVLSYNGEHQAALESINTAIKLHARSPVAFIGYRAEIYFFLREFEKALIDMEQSEGIREWGSLAIVIHGARGDPGSAKPYLDARLAELPWLNRQYYRIIWSYYRRPEDMALVIDSARKAGVPEFAYGYDPEGQRTLDQGEIIELAGRGLWKGHTHDGSEIYQQFSSANRVAIRSADMMMSGNYHLKNDRLCVTFRSVLLDLPDCGYVYVGDNPDEVTWVTLGEVYRFKIDR
jgi:adenylate cyclase